MLKLRKTRRALGMTAAALALAGGTAVITAGTANASSGSQSLATTTAPLSTTYCSGYAAYTDNQAWGVVSSPYGRLCEVNISQNGGSFRQSYTTGITVSTPQYWHGWASNGSWLTDRICVVDHTTGEVNCRSV